MLCPPLGARPTRGFPPALRPTRPAKPRPGEETTHEGAATDNSSMTPVPEGRQRQLAEFSDNNWDVPLEVSKSRSQLNSSLLIEHGEDG